MKNKILVIMISAALLLSACGKTATASQSNSTRSFAGQAELVVGILKLEGTDQAVTAEQASELLELWEMDKVLAASDTSAQDEIDATMREVKETLTPAQLQAISNMKLTEQDVSAFEKSLKTNTIQGSSQTSAKGSGGAFGGPPAGGPGGDSLGGILSGSSQLQGSTTGTTSASSSGVAASSQLPSGLVDALINLLKERVNT